MAETEESKKETLKTKKNSTVDSKEEKAEKPNWVKMKSADVDKIIIDLAKKGESPARIGLALRDQHGIPKAKLVTKKISEVIESAGLTIKKDKERITGKLSGLNSHIGKHKHDYTAKRSLTKQLWILHKIEKQQA